MTCKQYTLPVIELTYTQLERESKRLKNLRLDEDLKYCNAGQKAQRAADRGDYDAEDNWVNRGLDSHAKLEEINARLREVTERVWIELHTFLTGIKIDVAERFSFNVSHHQMYSEIEQSMDNVLLSLEDARRVFGEEFVRDAYVGNDYLSMFVNVMLTHDGEDIPLQLRGVKSEIESTREWSLTYKTKIGEARTREILEKVCKAMGVEVAYEEYVDYEEGLDALVAGVIEESR